MEGALGHGGESLANEQLGEGWLRVPHNRGQDINGRGTEPCGDLVGGGLHDADQGGNQPHLHQALTGFDLGQLLEDVLSQRGDHRIVTVLQEDGDGEGADLAFHARRELRVHRAHDAQGLHHEVEHLGAELGCQVNQALQDAGEEGL